MRMRIRSAGLTAVALMFVGVVGAASAVAVARPRTAVSVLQAVSCPSVATCHTVGGATVIGTIDGGTNWTVASSPPNAFDLTDTACVSAKTCWVIGSDNSDAGAVYKTVDGGTTWRVQSAVIPGGFFLAISCASRVVCVATGNTGAVFTTGDGGRSWHGQSLTDATLINGIDCPTTMVCEAVGYRGRDGVTGVALRTTDGGDTWTPQALPASVQFPTSVSCPSIDACVAVGQETIHSGSTQVGVIVTTADGGTTWRRRQVPDGYTDLLGVACPAAEVCEAVGDGPQAVLGTVDGGRTWTPQGPGTAALNGISCPNATTCVAVGQTNAGRAAIYRTTNGGHAWQRQPIG